MLVCLLVRGSACARRRSFLTWRRVKIVEIGYHEEGERRVSEEGKGTKVEGYFSQLNLQLHCPL